MDQLREMVEARTGSRKLSPEPRSSDAHRPAAASGPALGSGGGQDSGQSSPSKGPPAAADKAVVPVAAGAAEKPAPTIMLAEIGLPEVMPARQHVSQHIVRVVNI